MDTPAADWIFGEGVMARYVMRVDDEFAKLMLKRKQAIRQKLGKDVDITDVSMSKIFANDLRGKPSTIRLKKRKKSEIIVI